MAEILAQMAKLPVYNEDYKVGIAVSIDPSLASSEKLRLHRIPADLRGLSRDNVVKGCFTILMRDLWNSHSAGKSTLASELQLYGVYAGIQLGLIAEPTDSSNVVFADLSRITANEADTYFGTAINKNKLLNALSLAIATKACWWPTNHHFGGEWNKLSGYLQKVFSNKNAIAGVELTSMTDAIYTLGHFYDTRRVLVTASIKGIAKLPSKSQIRFNDDSILRFQSMPAGTHRLAVSYKACKCLLGSKLAVYVPSIYDFNILVARRNAVLADPAAHHIGAYYLTGGEREDDNDLDNSTVMGRLGSYIRDFMGVSILAKWPQYSQEKVQSYLDYSADCGTAFSSESELPPPK